MPELSIGLKNGQVVVSWPLEFEGYSLQWTNDLGSETLTEVSDDKINRDESEYSYIQAMDNESTRFYRLIKE
jgi:hypothetical protein